MIPCEGVNEEYYNDNVKLQNYKYLIQFTFFGPNFT